jgi:hypothetical protein
MGSVSPDQRFSRWNPCPICEGHAGLRPHRGERCAGYLSDDGNYAFCQREHLAGDLPPQDTTPVTYRHYLAGPCHCGDDHRGSAPRPSPKGRAKPTRRYTFDESRAYYERLGYRFITTYVIRDADALIAAYHDRYERPDDKKMPWRAPDGLSDLPEGISPNDLPLYGSETVKAAHPRAPVYLTEGEKACEALCEHGAYAVATVTGADGLPCDDSLRILSGRLVRLWPDNDAKGAKHMRRIAERLAALD